MLINGQRSNGHTASEANDNSNPYAKPSAPSADEVNNSHMPYSNLPAYPPYPSNNNGYPPYPTNNNNGYPLYPTNNNNRPGVDQYGYPMYPPVTSRPTDNRYHNNYPQHNLPQANPGWGNQYPNSIYRKNSASSSSVSLLLLLLSFLIVHWSNSKA